MTDFPTTKQNRINRLPKRGHYDRETIYPILDEALICHVGITEGDQPFVIPINFARVGDTIYLHGAKTSRLLNQVAQGKPVCIEAAIVDGLVLARSVFHHSLNYRSVMVFGKGQVVESDEGKMAALEAVVEHLIPGRWQDARRPNKKELDSTLVVAIQIESASAKVRVGPPGDDAEDYALPVWAGVLPLQELPLPVLVDEQLAEGIPVPGYIAGYTRPR